MAEDKKKDRYEENKAKMFDMILGQCDDDMKNKLKSESGYDKVDEQNEVVTLLQKDPNYSKGKGATIKKEKKKGICFKCKKQGHIEKKCRENEDTDGNNAEQQEQTHHQQR